MAWENVMEHLDDEFLVLVPDQRGYNLSDAPEGEENYRAKLLVQDMISLMETVIGQRPFSLGGHDWGASIAYAMCINFPDKINHLLIANGVHPVCFQRAMIDYPAQAKASAYFHILRSGGAAPHMCADNFAKTLSMFEKFSSTPWLTEELKNRYRKAWDGEKRMAAMLHWYNSSPIVVPKEGEPIPNAPLYDGTPDRFGISMPHTLVWGDGDQALLPVCHEHLNDFCSDMRHVPVHGADHWLLHTHGELVASEIRKLISD